MLMDVYVLATSRTAAQVERFLGHFLPDRHEAACEYLVPQYSDQPDTVLTDVGELLRLCERRPDLYQSVYWTHATPGGEPHSAHAFFLADGGLVLGLSTASWDGADALLAALLTFAQSRIGYITCERPPVTSTACFRGVVAGVVHGRAG